jgi:hypothetical protein
MDTDKETEKARKEVKAARDEFNAIKKVRCVVLPGFPKGAWSLFFPQTVATSSTRRIITSPITLIKYTKTLPREKRHRKVVSHILVWKTAR